MGDVGHTRISPSNLRYYMTCEGYTPDDGKDDQIEDSDEDDSEAQRGTVMHAAMERADWAHLPVEEQDLCEWALNEQVELLTGCGRIDSEVKLHVVDLMIGTADVVAFHNDGQSAIVLDYKFGRIPVPPARTNWQGIAYAVAVAAAYPHIKRVMVGFLQPRLRYKTTHWFTREHLMMLRDAIKATLTRREGVDMGLREPVLRADWGVCRWCAKVASCPAARDAIVPPDVGKQAVPNMTPPADWSLDPATWVRPDLMDYGLALRERLKWWVDQAGKDALRMLAQDAGLSEEWGLKTRAGRRVIPPEMPVEALADATGLPTQTLEGLVKRSYPIHDVEKRMREAHGAKEARERVRRMAEDGIIEQADPSTLLSRRLARDTTKPQDND